MKSSCSQTVRISLYFLGNLGRVSCEGSHVNLSYTRRQIRKTRRFRGVSRNVNDRTRRTGRRMCCQPVVTSTPRNDCFKFPKSVRRSGEVEIQSSACVSRGRGIFGKGDISTKDWAVSWVDRTVVVSRRAIT